MGKCPGWPGWAGPTVVSPPQGSAWLPPPPTRAAEAQSEEPEVPGWRRGQDGSRKIEKGQQAGASTREKGWNREGKRERRACLKCLLCAPNTALGAFSYLLQGAGGRGRCHYPHVTGEEAGTRRGGFPAQGYGLCLLCKGTLFPSWKERGGEQGDRRRTGAVGPWLLCPGQGNGPRAVLASQKAHGESGYEEFQHSEGA